MRKLAALALAVVLSLMPPPLFAARSTDTGAVNRLELLVIEVKGCNICDLVRTHIQPAYEASPRAAKVPLRYVDITHMDELKLGLNAKVQTVPTIVLLRDGREVDRITGYLGPKNFFAILNDMLETFGD